MALDLAICSQRTEPRVRRAYGHARFGRAAPACRSLLIPQLSQANRTRRLLDLCQFLLFPSHPGFERVACGLTRRTAAAPHQSIVNNNADTMKIPLRVHGSRLTAGTKSLNWRQKSRDRVVCDAA